MTTETVQFMTTVATLLTAAAALLTILEMRRQRKTQYRPVLIVKSGRFAVKPSGSSPSNRVVVSSSDRSSYETEDDFFGSLKLDCFNVGFGAALDITVDWDYDLEAIVTRLSEFEGKIGGRLWIEEHSLHFESTMGESWHAFFNKHNIINIIPPSTDSGHTRIVLPSHYTVLVGLLLSAASDSESGMKPLQQGLPSLTLQLTWRDLDGQNHKKRYSVTPQISHLSFAGSPEQSSPQMKAGSGRLTLKEI